MSLQSKLSHRRSDYKGDTSPLFSNLTIRVATATAAEGCYSILGNSGYSQFRIDCNPGITFLISRRVYLPSKPCTPIYTAQGAQCNTSITIPVPILSFRFMHGRTSTRTFLRSGIPSVYICTHFVFIYTSYYVCSNLNLTNFDQIYRKIQISINLML